MAGLRAKLPPVGSAPWLLNERTEMADAVEEGVEEFAFSVHNELDWLNEHMSDIFSKNQINVTDIFKTPGKLRGKTPRTAKRNPLEARLPLSDIFAPSQPSPQVAPSPKSQFYRNIEQIQIAKDADASEPPSPSKPDQPRTATVAPAPYHDSGYHGSFRSVPEQMDVDKAPASANSPLKDVLPAAPSDAPEGETSHAPAERRVTDESFVSARELPSSQHALLDKIPDDDDATVPDENMAPPSQREPPEEPTRPTEPTSPPEDELPSTAPDVEPSQPQAGDGDDAQPQDDTPSDGSSPVKPLVRKSSLTFASLPAREPLKKSMGARISRVSHAEPSKFRASQRVGPESPTLTSRISQFGRFTGGKSLGGSQHAALQDDKEQEDDPMDVDAPSKEPEESGTSKMHNMTSTQRLHERINMLGKAKEQRPSKSIAANSQSQPTYPQLPSLEDERPKHPDITDFKFPPREVASQPNPLTAQDDDSEDEDDEEDWIAPMRTLPGPLGYRPPLPKANSADVMEGVVGKTSIGTFEKPLPPAPAPRSPVRQDSPKRPGQGFGHSKSATVIGLPSPERLPPLQLSHKKSISVSNPDNMPDAPETTTPAGSPTGRRYADGPLSASKAKFFSVLKSAKERFIASAGVSAQAKMEALSPTSNRSRQNAPVPPLDQIFSPPKRDDQVVEARNQELDPRIGSNAVPLSPTRAPPSPTRGPPSPTRAQEGRRTRSSSEREREREDKRKERAAREQQKQADNLEKAREKVRQEAAAHTQKAKNGPQPTSRPGAESRTDASSSRDELNQSADEMPPPQIPKSQLPLAPKPRDRRLVKPAKETAPKAPILVKVPMNRHPQPQSSNSTLSSFAESVGSSSKTPSTIQKPSTDSLKSSTSQQRARQLDVVAKKREQEKAVAQRKAEQKREQEQKRAKLEEDRRIAEQAKKAADQRLQEAKKAAAQRQAADLKARQQATRPPSRQANTLTSALQQEKANSQQSHQRSDLGSARPISRLMHDNSRTIVPQINPAKPPKRAFTQEEEDTSSRPAMSRAGPSYQQLESKRRKTDELEEPVEPRGSVMKPPIRQSNIRKEPNKFAHGYMTVPTPSQNPMLKAATTAQQHAKTGYAHEHSKFANGKIPFAEAPNPPAGSSQANSYHSAYKTPARPTTQASAPNTAKSSPHYPPSEAITLPDIATDSEDEEEEGFRAPSWTDSPALRELLSRQQLVDPQQIFGPIAPLQMEEVFKNKDRHKRFRDRTSSANWAGADRLTEEERRKDREGRERMMRDGGWTFDTIPG